ncbi:MAG TPA: hybrid sensor histidine kinase/response regulator [Polyangia bacterium]|jgi:signal transduction histidine kinase|nr:hybrid sensor histidine kinase/response regulator [Polyangia bacterium]
MLPDERTTHSNTLSLPSDVEGLVAAPGRGVARPLVDFLRGQGINVQTTADADSAFEEALLHPPDVVLIDDRLPPAGGIELCQRLKGNVRTHFVPVIVFALNDLRPYRLRALAAGADAVFGPGTDAQERRTRLWALLRTRALYRQLEKKQRAQGSEIVDRRRWLGHFLHDLQGQVAALNVNVDYLAKLAPPKGDVRLENFLESIEDVRTVFAQLMANVRTVQDYDRYETAQLVPQETFVTLGDLAEDVADELRRQAVVADRPFSFARPPAATERRVQGDRELLRRAMLNLGLSALRRAPVRNEVAMTVTETDAASRFRVTVPGESLQGGDRLNIFEPYAQRTASSAGYGLGLALARAIIELHEGHLWIEDVPEGGCAFVFELKWQRRGPRAKRPGDQVERV